MVKEFFELQLDSGKKFRFDFPADQSHKPNGMSTKLPEEMIETIYQAMQSGHSVVVSTNSVGTGGQRHRKIIKHFSHYDNYSKLGIISMLWAAYDASDFCYSSMLPNMKLAVSGTGERDEQTSFYDFDPSCSSDLFTNIATWQNSGEIVQISVTSIYDWVENYEHKPKYGEKFVTLPTISSQQQPKTFIDELVALVATVLGIL